MSPDSLSPSLGERDVQRLKDDALQKAVREGNDRYARVFLQMLAEARASREAGTLNSAWRGREFSGREDWDRKQRGEDWA